MKLALIAFTMLLVGCVEVSGAPAQATPTMTVDEEIQSYADDFYGGSYAMASVDLTNYATCIDNGYGDSACQCHSEELMRRITPTIAREFTNSESAKATFQKAFNDAVVKCIK